MISEIGRAVHQAYEHALHEMLDYRAFGKRYLVLHHKECVDGVWGAALATELLGSNGSNAVVHLPYQYVDTPQIKIDPNWIPDYIISVDMSPNDADIEVVTSQYPDIKWLITDHHDDARVERITRHAENSNNISVVFSKYLGGSFLLKALFRVVNGVYAQIKLTKSTDDEAKVLTLPSNILEGFIFNYITLDHHFGPDKFQDITYFVGFRDVWLERSTKAKQINMILRDIILTNPDPIQYLSTFASGEMDLFYIYTPFEKFSPEHKPDTKISRAYDEFIDRFIAESGNHITAYYQTGLLSMYQVAESEFYMATNLSEIGAERKLKFAVGTIPTVFVSDTSEAIYSDTFKGHDIDFVLTVMPAITGDYMYLSLRSKNPSGADLLKVLPKLFGPDVGGGHKHAAGGRITFNQGVKFLRSLKIIAR